VVKGNDERCTGGLSSCLVVLENAVIWGIWWKVLSL
jgi:hypothetical protein